MFDVRSAKTLDILKANPTAYERLVVKGDTPAFAHACLDGVDPDALLDRKPPSPLASQLTLAALWLWHDGLSQCHAIVQKDAVDILNIKAPASRLAPYEPAIAAPAHADESLAYWHAIMHRREGDFSNSKYWYARAAGHPILESMANHMGPAVNTMPADRTLLRMVARGFDANAWVDFIQQAHRDPSPDKVAAAVHLQQLEWRALFDHCTRL